MLMTKVKYNETVNGDYSGDKLEVYYVDNLPLDANIADIYQYFSTYRIYSIHFHDKKHTDDFRKCWVTLEKPNANRNDGKTKKLAICNLNVRLMGHFLPAV